MVYKKYIKRNGKFYGPYIYHSRRVNGKVISEYHGTIQKVDYKKFIFIFLGVILASGLIYGIASNKIRLTGHATDLEPDYQEAQELPLIANLTVTQLHESDETPHKYNLSLEVESENLDLDYFWEIDCGNISQNASFNYSNVVEWYTTGECMDAMVNVSVIDKNGYGQRLIQPVFNSSERVITTIGLVSETEEEVGTDVDQDDISTDDETKTNDITTDTAGIIESGVVPESPPEEPKIVEVFSALTDEERQILIDGFGNDNIKTKVKLFNDRIVVRYELGEIWIENSYNSDLNKEELEKQMETDRTRWLRDIINHISKEEIQEQELEGFEEGYSI